MAKEILGYIKLQIPAGSANPAPPVGPALGQKGLNIHPTAPPSPHSRSSPPLDPKNTASV